MKQETQLKEGNKRYKKLTELIDECLFSEVAEAIVPDINEVFTINNNIANYHESFGVFLSLLPLADKEFNSIIEKAKKHGEKEFNNAGRSRYSLQCYTARHLGKELKKKQVAKGVSTTEIGGRGLDKVIKSLGGTIKSFDAERDILHQCVLIKCGIGHKEAIYGSLEKSGDLITLSNYKQKFQAKYDFSISNKVFNYGSGIRAMNEDLNEHDAVLELLAVYSNITKLNGYSIHGKTSMSIDKEEAMNYFGFTKTFEKWYWDGTLLVFSKQDPNPEVFPNGLKIGYKTIDYDKKKGEFCLKE